MKLQKKKGRVPKVKDEKVRYVKIPIKATPYKHQLAAFEFVSKMFGLASDDDQQEKDPRKEGG